MERYEHLEKALCKELEKLNKKYTADTEMTEQDAERADTIFHALKSAETYYAMKEAEEEESEYSGDGYRRGGRSYRGSYSRGRDMRTGRYVSRDAYPMEYIDPYWDRRY